MKRYPKVLSLGHNMLVDIFTHPVEISEKADGSQARIYLTEMFSQCGSKNTTPADEKMFAIAHQQTQKIWEDGAWESYGNEITLFAEFFNNVKHNGLTYNRVPLNNFYLFGARVDGKHYQTEALIELANSLNIEPPNILASEIMVNSEEDLNKYLNVDSVLGGTVVEGIVIKNYHDSYPPLLASTQAFFGYPLIGKIVNDFAKERINKEWGVMKRKTAPITKITTEFLTEARFNKAVQHLADEGTLNYEMKDLKVLIPEFYKDLLDEEKDEIIKLAMEDFWRHLKKKCDVFVVNSWKDHLIKKQFTE